MARQATQPNSIYEAFNLYTAAVRASEPESKAYATLAQTQSALLRYALPAMGFPAPKGKNYRTREAIWLRSSQASTSREVAGST